MIKTLTSLFILARLNKPIGILLLLFPCWWGMAYVQKTNLSLSLFFLFSFGAIIMRSAGCILNDFFDKEVDKNVARTKNRPLASGVISERHALIFFALLCLIGLIILLQLPFDCWPLGILALVLLIIYPLMKRITNFPQAILGFAFNIGFLIAVVACTKQLNSIFTLPIALIYGGAILWTIAYDTVYAVQDREDDIKLNVKSTAVLFGKHTKSVTIGLYLLSALLMGLAGKLHNLSPMYFLFILLGYGYALVKLKWLNLDNLDACREFFISNQWMGLAIFFAFLWS